jgi:pimeloyl-ACP methyl ester carboxylesterase
MTLHYEVHGDSGPHMLLLHGMLSSRAQWLANMDELGQRCRLVVAELMAHGRSASPHDPEVYAPEAYVEALDRIRESLGIGEWFICGQSFGAALTLRYALTYPDRVIGQVFTNSNSALADPEQVAVYRRNAEERIRVVQEGGLAAIEQIPVHPRHARRLPEEVHAALLEDSKLLDPEGLVMTFRHTSPYLTVRDRVAETRVPTMLVCGDREKRFQPARDFAEATIPGIEVVDATAGHAVNIQAADAFNRAVGGFIDRLS